MSKSDAGVIQRLLHSAVRRGFRKAYPHAEVDPDKYLQDVQRIYNLPIQRWKDAHLLDEQELRPVADRIIASSARMAALEGMGLGMGGFATMLPDMGILAAITLRMLQKLSLVHGFEYSTTEEVAALWVAVATAAGVKLTRDFIEKQTIERLAPRIIDAMAVKVGAEVAEKWAARIVPLVSGAASGVLNYYFVRAWGRRAHQHFLEKHRDVRSRSAVRHALVAATR